MRTLMIPFLLFFVSHFVVAQNSEDVKTLKNSIIITPLGDLLNNSKSSIYFRRVLKSDSKKYVSLRIGMELFNSIDNKYSSGLKQKSSSWNFKAGLELGKRIDKMVVYFGGEISSTTSKINDATLFPNENAIFSANSIIAEEQYSVDETRMSIFSVIGFIGFKYELTSSFLVGIESAIGAGNYESIQRYDDDVSFPQGETHRGKIKDLSINRFILLEYRF